MAAVNAPHERILLAKIGLDGHDRGVKLLARSFRDAGFEVIYTGLWQTAESSMHAAMQEDVDVVGVSLLSAAHMTVMPEVLRWRRELRAEDVPVVLGGIVPESDYQSLLDMGVAAVFNPGSSVDDILKKLRELARARRRLPVPTLQKQYAAADVAALAQLITAAQRGELDDGWSPPGSRSRVVGVTGSPGVGKSSFIGRLGKLLTTRGHKVGVVAIDPSSPITGGALLGDRLRMMTAEPNRDLFIRSVASGKTPGAMGPNVARVASLMAGFGFDVVLVETVGAGQADTALYDLTKNIILIHMPESGDDVQFTKAGIMEIASAFVLNKGDLPGADATLAHLSASVPDDRPIWRVSSARNQGLDAVADWVEALPS
jgi:LAO/AO transport system ATPase